MEISDLTNVISISDFAGFTKESSVEVDLNKRVVLIIGKNNSGKSSVSRAIRSLTHEKEAPAAPIISSQLKITQEMIDYAFPKNVMISDFGLVEGSFNRAATQALLGVRVSFQILKNAEVSFDMPEMNPALREAAKTMVNKAILEWRASLPKPNRFFALSAERNIVPEANGIGKIDDTGKGLTSILIDRAHSQKYANDTTIEDAVACLNEILGGDLSFEKLEVRSKDSGVFEVMLKERGKGNLLGLSSLGSGLKTLLLVIFGMYLYPDRDFCFDELENSLHPTLQRRLFEYVYQRARETGKRVVITTHSSVPLNLFFGKEDVEIIRTWKSDGVCRAERIDSNQQIRNCLDDLGNHPSDLLQSNGIIWVEGPSDRVYIEKWLKLAGCKQQEGIHYSYGYTGGKNLAQYDVDEQNDGRINMLFVCRNAFIIMDRDRDDGDSEIADTKQRILNEAKSKSVGTWVTKGREIENYVRKETLERAFGEGSIQFEWGEYSKAGDLVAQLRIGKVDLARRITDCMTEDDLSVMDLKTRIDELVEAIEKWNPKTN
jgi:energy-coupling factor transporter ATP-binding protein EcfA2